MNIKSIDKSFGPKQVVSDVSFEIPKNKLTSLIGPNGAGKSTVLNMITRLIARDNGQILIDDQDIADYKAKELSKRLAILTQTNHITMKLSVRELVAFGRFPHSGSHLRAEDYEYVDKAIAYMELEEFQDRFIDELSGGQRQRAYIAMVIAQDTEYVFLDEPTNNLDIYHSSNMMKLCRRLCDELGKTVILVLHEINFASSYSDYIGAFLDGKLHKFGTVDEVMNKEVLKELYKVDFEIMQINDRPVAMYY
ncbi:MAG: ATP-binding cassette domain-containing protein [Eubacteriales bacterium]